MRSLFLLNRVSGTGLDADKILSIEKSYAESLPDGRMQIIEDHPAARLAAKQFLAESEEPATIIVGGGGGTLRATVEGICDSGSLPGKGRIRIAPLRLGSGNVVAKHFGIPLDPQTALKEIRLALQDDATAPCCVIRCETPEAIHYAVTMAGLGQFGRAPGDLARWHKRLAPLRNSLAKAIRLETLNDFEYLLAIVIRTFACIVTPAKAETVSVRFGDDEKELRMFTGVLLNFPIRLIPVAAGVRIEEKRLAFHLVPFTTRSDALLTLFRPLRISKKAVQFMIEEGQTLEFSFPTSDRVEFFLDEDPVFSTGPLKFSVAGTLSVVPGFAYRNATQ